MIGATVNATADHTTGMLELKSLTLGVTVYLTILTVMAIKKAKVILMKSSLINFETDFINYLIFGYEFILKIQAEIKCFV